MPVLWTFEDQDKLKPFLEILKENDIGYVLLSKGKQVESDTGLALSVEEADVKKAKRLLLSHRKRISNRHSK
jgi:hypothetical protein